MKKKTPQPQQSNIEDKKILNLVKRNKLNSKELETLLKSTSSKADKSVITWKDYQGDYRRIGIVSDSHIGHKEFDEDLVKHIADTFKENDVKTIYHCGDILEGMSGRPGHVYELSEIGFENQLKRAEQVIGDILGNFEVKGINGNHDEWYMKKGDMGINPSYELSKRISNYTHLGDNEADVMLRKNVRMKLFHPNDGTAYATSYKLQKLVESFSGGEKPEIVIEGHYHKALYMFSRNIHSIEAGTLCGQTGWMRGKKIPAHKGAWMIDIDMGRGGIGIFSPTYIPGYK